MLKVKLAQRAAPARRARDLSSAPLRPTRPGFYQRHGPAGGGVGLQSRMPYRGYAGAGQPLWATVFWTAQPFGMRASARIEAIGLGSGTQNPAQQHLRHAL